ncbi:MAG TPA: AraC family transcriptional regulator [Candidatus Megamonas gallistercoris]|nr:AraC family transcriptional regulator [Candidatus Megamonas gallistercoris]
MLQYFINNKYKSTFDRLHPPKLEYFCKVDETSSTMPRTMHMHTNLVEILLVYNGNGIYMIENDKYTAQKGDLILYNSNVPHDEFGGSGTGLCTYCLGISNLKLSHLEKNMIISPDYIPVIGLGKSFDEFLTLFQCMEHNIIENEPYLPEFTHYLTEAIIVKTCHIVKTNGIVRQQKILSLSDKVKDYIDKHYNEQISLEQIAEAVKANKYYLAHMFKAETGFSPLQYVVRRRIGEAQNLLINTDMSITQIAATVGYNNSNYFQNIFRKYMGMTPGYYRKKWKS